MSQPQKRLHSRQSFSLETASDPLTGYRDASMIPECPEVPESLKIGFMYHDFQMRRSISILLALIFGLGPLSFALLPNDDASLPACCRRHGAHHCAMSSEASSYFRTPAFTSPAHCPLFPQYGNASPTSTAALARTSVFSISALEEPRPGSTFQASADNIYLSTPSLRGPPSSQDA